MNYIGPEETGVYFTQICYDVLKFITDMYQRFDYLNYLVNRVQSAHYVITNLKETWEYFLETFPHIDIIMQFLP